MNCAEKLEPAPKQPKPRHEGTEGLLQSGEDSNLGKTGQMRMEINVVTIPVQNNTVFYPATNPTPNMLITLVRECEDALNHLGNCYSCNKPGHLKKDCPERNNTQAQTRSSNSRGQRREVICFNCDKTGHFARQCRGPKKNYRRDNPQGTEKLLKTIKDMLVKCNSKPEDFQ